MCCDEADEEEVEEEDLKSLDTKLLQTEYDFFDHSDRIIEKIFKIVKNSQEVSKDDNFKSKISFEKIIREEKEKLEKLKIMPTHNFKKIEGKEKK